MNSHSRPIILLYLFLLLVLLASCRPGAVPSKEALAEVTPIQTPTPVQTAAIALPVEIAEETKPDDLDIPYTENNPLTDLAEILRILDILQGRELTWFSRSGWLHFTTEYADASDYTRIENLWVHVIDENQGCLEQFVYFEYEGNILPYTIRPEGNIAGVVSINPEELEPEGEIYVERIFENGPACTLKSSWIRTFQESEDDEDFIIHDEAAQFRSWLNQDTPGIEDRFRAWVEEMDGKSTLVVEREKTYANSSLAGVIYDPRTGLHNLHVRDLQWIYIDLETGLQVRAREAYYDEYGEQLNTWRSGTNIGILFHYEFYEELPEPVAQAYDQAAQALSVFLQEGKQ